MLHDENSVKGIVVRILSEEWPLTIRKLYFIAKKVHMADASYQAFFKAVKELCEKGMLKKEGREYSIDLTWVVRNRTHLDRILENYKARACNSSWRFEPRVAAFVHEIGPKVIEAAGESGICVAAIGGGPSFGIGLKDWLRGRGKDVLYIELPRTNQRLPRDAEGRFVVAVDSEINTGKTYRHTMSCLKKYEAKLKLVGIKFATNYDRTGLADWAFEKAI